MAQSITVSGPSSELKNIGDCVCTETVSTGSAGLAAADPINVGTGNSFQTQTDFVGAANTGLSLSRTYNSQDVSITPFGVGWRDVWHRGLNIAANSVTVIRADGRQNVFTNSGSIYLADPDVTSTLKAVFSGSTITGYQLTDAADVTETYSATGQLLTITSRAGLVTTLTYNSSNQLAKVTGPFGHVMSFTYNAGGQVASMTAPDGGVYAYAYDAHLNLISVTYPDKTIRKYVYEVTAFPNLLTGIIDENSVRYTTWTYDSQGRATSSQHAGVELNTVAYTSATASTVTDPRGTTRTYNLATQFSVVKPTSLIGTPFPALGGSAFTYDANGFIASKTDFDGNVTTYTHDTRGDQLSRTEASGTAQARTISTTWLSTFHLPTLITEPNRSTAFTYDAHGNMLTKVITAGSLTRSYAYTYNSSGQVLTATDPNGHVTSYTYDAKGDLSSVTDALGHVTSFTSYDGAGRLLNLKDPNGVITSLTYDARGRLITRTVGTLTNAYAYDKAGNLIKIVPPDQTSLALTYDPAHRLTGITDNLGDKIAYTLDAASNKIKEQVYDPSGILHRTRSYTYDSVNRISQMIGAQSQTTNYAYDPQSNLTKITDPMGVATSYVYDALNRLTKESDWNATANISYNYDANDHLTGVIDPRSLTTSYAWNGLDEQTSQVSPDTGKTTRTFDAAGNVLTLTDARGDKTTFTYDALNRKTKAVYADGTSATWQYDQGTYGIGHLSKLTDTTGSTSYTYDINGHVTQKVQVIGSLTLTTAYTYDTADTGGARLSQITYPSGLKVAYGYDAAGRVSEVTANRYILVAIRLTYFPFGPVLGWMQGDEATYQRSFDLDGRITGLTLPAKDTIALTYDLDSHISSMTETGLATKQFSYDVASRLVGYANGTSLQTYSYDASGNRTGTSINSKPAYSLTYAYDKASNHLLNISGSTAESFTYDASGNMLTYGSNNSFAYDARGRRTVAYTGAVGTFDQINGLGQRVVSQEPTGVSAFANAFAYDEAGHLIGRYGSNGAVIDETIWLGDLPIAMITPGGMVTYYIAPDHLGSPHQITDGNNAQVWFWDHDPFGNGAPTSTFTENLRFLGQYHDSGTGFAYNYYRDYDPATGRYIESDPIGLAGGVNTYAYVGGNPLGDIDPTGQAGTPATYNFLRTFCLLQNLYCGDITNPDFYNPKLPPQQTEISQPPQERPEPPEIPEELQQCRPVPKMSFPVQTPNSPMIPQEANPSIPSWLRFIIKRIPLPPIFIIGNPLGPQST